MRGLALAAVALAVAAPAVAAQWTPPAGCRLELTVQQRSCTVAQHYRCDADAPGDQRVTYFTKAGRVHESRIDAETRWMESTDLVSGVTDRLDPASADHASLSTLLETGRDDFDFWTRSSTGERLRHIGGDRLTGETVKVSGVTLDVTTFRLKTFSESGDLLIDRQGGQFVNREQGRFYGGVETATDWTGETQDTNDTPMRLIAPGQPGFASTTPEYDCDLLMTQRATGKDAT